jgi:uncharacterized membrane protein
MEKSILQHFLPDGLLDNFEITKIEEVVNKKEDSIDIHIYLEEYNKLPEEYDAKDYESKGFYPAKKILDFSIRGKTVYLVIKRRRWRNKVNKSEEIHNDYTFIADGSKMTKELSDFLKYTD